MSENKETIEEFMKRVSQGPGEDITGLLGSRLQEYEANKVQCSLLAPDDREISSGQAHFLGGQTGPVTFYPDQRASVDSFEVAPNVLQRQSGQRHTVLGVSPSSTDPEGCYLIQIES